MRKGNKPRPIKLDEVEERFFDKKKVSYHRKIEVDELSWREYQRIVEQRFRRKIIIFTIAFSVLVLTLSIVLPDRYPVIRELLSLFFATVSGYTIGQTKKSNFM